MPRHPPIPFRHVIIPSPFKIFPTSNISSHYLLIRRNTLPPPRDTTPISFFPQKAPSFPLQNPVFKHAMDKPVLQKPPGYKDPSISKPPLKKPLKSSRRNPTVRSFLCRIFCCFSILFIILLSAFLGFCYLWFHPQLPSFRVKNVTADVFKIRARSDGTFLDAALTVKIQAENFNSRVGLVYRGGEGNVKVDDLDLGGSDVAGFVLGRKNLTVVRVGVKVKGLLVDDEVGVRLRRRYGSGEILFFVEMRFKLGFVVGGKLTGKFPIRVKCAGVSLREVRSMRPLPKCDIDFFNG